MGNREGERVGAWRGGGETEEDEEGATLCGDAGCAREGSRVLRRPWGEKEKMREKSGER
jgi:hypothetical protein